MIRTAFRSAWVLSTLPGARAFSRALGDCAAAQRETLGRILSRASGCSFLAEHGVDGATDLAAFRSHVPVRSWEELRPWTDAVVAGVQDVLTRDPVRRLVPTSGTSGGRKLVPCGAALLDDFRRALNPWIWDLHASDPRLLAGSAYWAISPPGEFAADARAAHPVGFEDDSAYFGPFARLAEWIRPVPASTARLEDVDKFRQATLLHLLRRRDLAFVSIWHPSFLELLLDHLQTHWDRLLADLATGRIGPPAGQKPDPSLPADPRLSRTLGAIGPDPTRLWPRLRQVSAWTDGASAGAARRLAGRLPGVSLVGKGLLSTEGVASIPWKGCRPLAVCSHFLEFLESSGTVRGAADLVAGERYELVLTTSGGMWRMRTGDLVEVEEFFESTPCIRFLGRASGVVDLVGEKLDEVSVASALERALPEGEFALVVPRQDGKGYLLLVESRGINLEQLGEACDRNLRTNPHYDLARRLGQLSAIQCVCLEGGSRQHMSELWSHFAPGASSVSKPPVLHASADWAQRLGVGS